MKYNRKPMKITEDLYGKDEREFVFVRAAERAISD